MCTAHRVAGRHRTSAGTIANTAYLLDLRRFAAPARAAGVKHYGECPVWGELHEEKEIIVTLPEVIEAGKGNRLFLELGATLHYDVYDFSADSAENWQSESLLHVTLMFNGSEVDAQEDFNVITLAYPFALRPSSNQQDVLNLINKIIAKFNAVATYQGQDFSVATAQSDWDLCNDFLLKEWGEEPGSKSLRIMIEENYA
ncbi:Uncharacterised protein [BD1-7 clade bacterium]|uniref:Uncharacterized protein n=1 Tax=BD1-7 clade bacterium TaxID=2029982 RepID=A0A5S9QS08_9GAMM|nr:Uncharacterised protein [BD1-7 clade bacterium]